MAVESHMTSFNESDCIIPMVHSYANLYVVFDTNSGGRSIGERFFIVGRHHTLVTQWICPSTQQSVVPGSNPDWAHHLFINFFRVLLKP